jgi:primosomal protein N'
MSILRSLEDLPMTVRSIGGALTVTAFLSSIKFCRDENNFYISVELRNNQRPTEYQSPKMKRKLDANDVPAPAEEAAKSPKSKQDVSTFSGLGLDSRLLQGISKQNFQTPTLVQSKAIPLALEGRDVLARAKTGSGKTAAYLLPILHLILRRKQVGFLIPCVEVWLTWPDHIHTNNLCAHTRTNS